MSEEYFCFEEINDESKFYEDYGNNNGGKHACSHSDVKKIKQDVRLHEMEQQLEIAENRCNTLKDQLDHMKKLYQTKTDITRHSRPHKKTLYSARNPSPLETSCNSKNANRSSASLTRGDRCTVIPRQNSQAITTDNSGAAVRTINNILNGITNSVNRLSQIHIQMEQERPRSSPIGKMCDSACGDDMPLNDHDIVNQSPKRDMETDNAETLLQIAEEQLHSITNDDVRRLSSALLSIQSKTTTKKRVKRKPHSINKNVMQNSTISINITNKKSLKSTAKHVEKKFKIEPVKMISKDSASILSPKKSKKHIRRPRLKAYSSKQRHMASHSTIDTDNLVEIYHNNAAKGSESDDSGPEVHKNKSSHDTKQPTKPDSLAIPSLPLEEEPSSDLSKYPEQYGDSTTKYNNNKQLTPIEEDVYMEPTAPRPECCFSTCSKNYELPTIASKMKQVAKSYLRRFNFHSIPFCAAKSTSPSHNIGINIQQVMSIIKTRQPVTGISPTLAHNIGLAAEKLQGRQFTVMVSSMGEPRAGYRRAICPLMRPNLNYQQLQEMAKEIPEEECEEETKELAEAEMACGDRNVVGCAQARTWTVDPTNQRNCTCIPQQGVGFQQVLNRYNNNSRMISASTYSQLQYRMPPRQNKFLATPLGVRSRSLSIKPYVKPLENKPSSPLKGKEKNLKEVLTNLHDEFAYINQQYEELTGKVEEMGSDTDEEILKQLKQLERSLSMKEEEISIVMGLYKEVVALKQQVKTLKERASIASVALNSHQQQYQLPRYVNDTNTALHLTKLLRQIQTYQNMNRIGLRN